MILYFIAFHFVCHAFRPKKVGTPPKWKTERKAVDEQKWNEVWKKGRGSFSPAYFTCKKHFSSHYSLPLNILENFTFLFNMSSSVIRQKGWWEVREYEYLRPLLFRPELSIAFIGTKIQWDELPSRLLKIRILSYFHISPFPSQLSPVPLSPSRIHHHHLHTKASYCTTVYSCYWNFHHLALFAYRLGISRNSRIRLGDDS